MVRRVIALCAFAWLAVLGAPAPAVGQQGPLLWNFDDGLQDWEVSGLWDADGSPATILPDQSPPIASAKSPPNSLNYNNGIDYDIGGNGGQAISPVIDIGQIENFGFWCTYDTEGEMDDESPGIDNINNFDLRLVVILDQDDNIVFARQYLNPAGENPPTWATDFPTFLSFEECGPPGGNFHNHWFPLDPAWGPIRVVFEFWTGFGPTPNDPVANDHTGWFVDDVAVTGEFEPPPGGTGGETRENANGDRGANDTFRENLCGAGAARSGILLAIVLAAMTALMAASSRP